MAAKTRVICCYALPSPEFARKVGNRAGLLKGKADRYSAETRLILFKRGPWCKRCHCSGEAKNGGGGVKLGVTPSMRSRAARGKDVARAPEDDSLGSAAWAFSASRLVGIRFDHSKGRRLRVSGNTARH